MDRQQFQMNKNTELHDLLLNIQRTVRKYLTKSHKDL